MPIRRWTKNICIFRTITLTNSPKVTMTNQNQLSYSWLKNVLAACLVAGSFLTFSACATGENTEIEADTTLTPAPIEPLPMDTSMMDTTMMDTTMMDTTDAGGL
jgi:hypothetical protein